MRVEFRETSFALDTETRTRAERCVMLALGRFQALVPSVAVSVVVAPAEPARPAPDHEVAVHVGGTRRFLVVEKDPDVVAAVGRAADRARRCLERDLTRDSLRYATAAPRNRGNRGRE